MSEIVKNIFDDKREILSIHETGDHQTSDYSVGQNGVTKIVPYQENGEYAHLTFLAIYKGDEISVRLSARNIHIYYKESSDE